MVLEGEECDFLSSEKEMTEERYIAQMQSLQKIREVAGGDLDFPQICVVGDQSSGKSALLSCLAGLQFPESSGICTRAPIVVECRCTDSPSEVYEIKNDPTTKSYTKCNDLEHLRDQISEIQEAAIQQLRTSSGPELRPESSSQESGVAGAGNGGSVARKTTQKSKAISTAEICVRVSGPKQMDIIIVDLPGIIHNGDGADETRELIDYYCQKKQTLALLVAEAKQDKESTEAIALTGKHDPDRERTLHVLTKFDMFDSPDSRQRAEKEIISTDKRGRGLASHAVVCRCDGGAYDADREAEILSQSDLPLAKSGVSALKRRLPALFSQLISQYLPNLRTQVQTQLDSSQQVLEQIGTDAVEGMAMIKGLQSILPTQTELEVILTPHMEQFRTEVAQTQGKITKAWTDSHFQNNAFTVSVFQGNDALLKCLDEITKWWEPLLQKYIELVKGAVRFVSDAGRDRTKSKTLSAPFLRAFSAEWSKHCNGILFQDFTRKCQESLQMEKDFGTINHYLDSKYQEGKVLPDELVQALAEGLETQVKDFHVKSLEYKKHLSEYKASRREHESKTAAKPAVVAAFQSSPVGFGAPAATGGIAAAFAQAAGTGGGFGQGVPVYGVQSGGGFGATGGVPYPDSSPKPEQPPSLDSEFFRKYLEMQRQAYIARYDAKSLFDQQKERLNNAVLAVWAVEQKTFVDLILKQTRDAIIRRREEWIHHEIYGNDIIRQNAVEDDEIRQKRRHAKEHIEKMKCCLKELNASQRA